MIVKQMMKSYALCDLYSIYITLIVHLAMENTSLNSDDAQQNNIIIENSNKKSDIEMFSTELRCQIYKSFQ